MPGLLLSQKMQAPLADDLASPRQPRGHVRLPRATAPRTAPRRCGATRCAEFARQALALLDHLELEQAVVGGTSLGANITLELAALAPERLRGMVIEMPVLDNAIPACARRVHAAAVRAHVRRAGDEGRWRRGARGCRARRSRSRLELVLDAVAQDPGPSGAVLQGILFGRTAPERAVRQTFDAPALVIGHPATPCTRSRTPTCSPPSSPTAA